MRIDPPDCSILVNTEYIQTLKANISRPMMMRDQGPSSFSSGVSICMFFPSFLKRKIYGSLEVKNIRMAYRFDFLVVCDGRIDGAESGRYQMCACYSVCDAWNTISSQVPGRSSRKKAAWVSGRERGLHGG